MIRVLVVDDHAVVTAGLALLLDGVPDIECVGQAGDGQQALEAVARLHPDVVLMDLSMPVLDGVGATARLTADHPDARVVVLTTFGDRGHVTAAIDAGAVGFLLKDSPPEAIAGAIRAAARGEAPLDPRAALALLERRRERPAVVLTGREREVVALVAEGLSNRQVARRLGISEKTVKAHLTSAFATIGVTDRVQATLWWQRTSGVHPSP